VDLDAYVGAHRATGTGSRRWSSGRRRRAAAEREVDELVELYQRTATHLSVVQSAGRDPVLVARLSTLVARAAVVVAGGRQAVWRDVVRFLRPTSRPSATGPAGGGAARRRASCWSRSPSAGFIASSPEAQLAVAPPEVVKQLVEEDFENYYSSAPAQDFAARVFTNNAYVAAQAILFGVLLGIPVLYVLSSTPSNVGVAGRADGGQRPHRPVLRADPPARPARADRRLRGVRAWGSSSAGPWSTRAGAPAAGRSRRRAARWSPGRWGWRWCCSSPASSRAS
jgi:hypothetical protein